MNEVEIPLKITGIGAIKAELRELKGAIADATDPEQIAKDFFEMDFKHWNNTPPMNNLQKIGRLFQFFGSCDFNHNNNELKFESADNGILIEIGFDAGKLDMLDIDFDYNGAGYGFKIDIYSLLRRI